MSDTFLDSLETEPETGLIQPGRPLEIPSEPQAWAKAVVDLVPVFADADLNDLETSREITAITTDGGEQVAVGLAGRLKATQKAIEAHYAPYCDGAYALHKALVAARQGALRPFSDGVAHIGKLAMEWDGKKRALAFKAAQAKAAEDRAVKNPTLWRGPRNWKPKAKPIKPPVRSKWARRGPRLTPRSSWIGLRLRLNPPN